MKQCADGQNVIIQVGEKEPTIIYQQRLQQYHSNGCNTNILWHFASTLLFDGADLIAKKCCA